MRLFTLNTLFALMGSVTATGVTLSMSPLTAGTANTITFTDAGGTPSLAQLLGGRYRSGNNHIRLCKTLTVTIPATIAASITNGFYLRVTSSINGGGTVINYSNRFSLSGLTGTAFTQFASAAANAAAAAPAPVVAGQQAAAGATTAQQAAMFTQAYNQQTGLTKYAPMQSIPPTQITKKQASPQNPTSAFVVATTFLAPPTILTTITNPQTFSVSSMENTAAAQSQPTGDMAKFLARWKD
ncbi:hypothetical protein AMS68_006727 [Peltaster fructicola]|uniref:Yeast cell wall synthesis Kre9/Knh1 C-terminal domain-containing protein n=1 Tax=Peltaster fructicola TaxID=286661 RepID=A0A6H0Y3K2_9PEZI|nr:hypothetical protein AMS68_006727 [Peltaster fructicola]